MTAAPLTYDEPERLAALHRYGILDTTPEEAFDEVVQLASSICGVPIALISLVDRSREWFKARQGLEQTEISRELSFCAHAILERDLFVVPDALADVRFAANPLVTGEPHIRFYAGAQLTAPDGLNLGALCVIDHQPRILSDVQRTALRTLARQVVVQLELRRQIAERTATEAKLQYVLQAHKRAESELERFFDVSLDLLCIAGVDGTFRRLNPAFEAVLGFSLAELSARPFIEFVHPEDRLATNAELERLRHGQKTVRFENRYVTKSGTIRHFAWTAAPVPEEGLIYAAARDITAMKLAEDALRRSDARTRSIIDNALGAIVTTNPRGVIDDVNPAAVRLFGYPAEELIGRDVRMLLDDPPHVAEILSGALGRVTEQRGRRRDGKTFTCELSLFEFSGDGGDGNGRHLAAHVLDLSDREEVDRLKRDFVSTVSHELRTPLTAIRGALGLLSSGVAGPLAGEAGQLVTVAERNSVRLIALINDILDFEKLERGEIRMERRPTALQRVFDRSAETLGPLAAQEGIAIDIERTSACVVGDEMRLSQVIVNLLSNAVKYSHRGDVVKISAHAHGARQIEVRVADSGRGIALAAQTQIFERFHQVDSSDSRAKPGTGLGLAICKAIVEQHGGTISVDSREGEGSTFSFRIEACP